MIVAMALVGMIVVMYGAFCCGYFALKVALMPAGRFREKRDVLVKACTVVLSVAAAVLLMVAEAWAIVELVNLLVQ